MPVQNQKNTNNPCIIIPLLSKNQIIAAESIEPTSPGLTILCVLLTHRAQLTTILSKIDPKTIQQLPSIKWNAKQIARSPIISQLNCSIIIADTFNFEIKKLRGLSKEEGMEHALQIKFDLQNSSPDPKAKILNLRAINDSNIKTHRLALKARNIGTWQAQGIFGAQNIVKHVSLSQLNGETLGVLITNLHNSLGIELDPIFQAALNKAQEEKSTKPYTEALKASLNEHFISYNPDELKEIVFEDAINIDFPNNITPIEELFPSISRTKSNDNSLEMEQIPNELLNSPLFAHAVEVNTKLSSELKRITPGKNSRNTNSAIAKSKPKSKAKSKPIPLITDIIDVKTESSSET